MSFSLLKRGAMRVILRPRRYWLTRPLVTFR